MQWADKYPVSRVKVIGFLNHVSSEDIRKAWQKEPEANFFQVDLIKIKGNLELLPWVADVNVKKQWPDTLVVELSEREAVAWWGEDRFIDKDGGIYSGGPGDGTVTLPNLPVFFAKDHQASDILRRYREFEGVLVSVGLGIRKLVLEERSSWRMVLDNDLLLLVDDLDFTKKLKRFMKFYRQISDVDRCLLERVDLRYDNGLAVKSKSVNGNNGCESPGSMKAIRS